MSSVSEAFQAIASSRASLRQRYAIMIAWGVARVLESSKLMSMNQVFSSSFFIRENSWLAGVRDVGMRQ
jgi:hypothetical protein